MKSFPFIFNGTKILIKAKYFKYLNYKKSYQESPEQAEHCGTRMVEIAQSMKDWLTGEKRKEEDIRIIIKRNRNTITPTKAGTTCNITHLKKIYT